MFSECKTSHAIIRIMTFSNFDEPSSPLCKSLNIIKLSDLVTFNLAVFMLKYHNQLLPAVFNDFFATVYKLHNYTLRESLCIRMYHESLYN